MDKPSDFKELNKGFSVNGIKYKRLVGTPNGVKKSTVVYASVISPQGKEIHKEVSRRLDNDRDMGIKLIYAAVVLGFILIGLASCTISIKIYSKKEF